jgi:hypothetical protein
VHAALQPVLGDRGAKQATISRIPPRPDPLTATDYRPVVAESPAAIGFFSWRIEPELSASCTSWMRIYPL